MTLTYEMEVVMFYNVHIIENLIFHIEIWKNLNTLYHLLLSIIGELKDN